MLIFIVEDDENICEIEKYALENCGYKVITFNQSTSFWEELKHQTPNLILLDIMLPNEDGLSILNKLKTNSRTKEIPIIMVTAKSTELDKVRGLDAGADDYIAKPFGIMELISRVKALLRRATNDSTTSNNDDCTVFEYKDIRMNTQKREVFVDGKECVLTYKEFELLKYFITNSNIVLSRDKIMEKVWGFDFQGETRTVDMHIKTLRKKLDTAGDYIVTIRNVGYKLD